MTDVNDADAAANMAEEAAQAEDQTPEETIAALLAQNEALARLIQRNSKVMSDLGMDPDRNQEDESKQNRPS